MSKARGYIRKWLLRNSIQVFKFEIANYLLFSCANVECFFNSNSSIFIRDRIIAGIWRRFVFFFPLAGKHEPQYKN